MRWFSRTKPPSLEAAWTYSAKATLWRLLPSREGFLVGEDRDTVGKKVSFFCLDQRSGRVCWSDVRFHESWWIGVETIHRDTVFLHEYAAPDMPDHKKIAALDLATGRVLWRNDELTFVVAHEDKVYASQTVRDERKFFELDRLNGNRLREIDGGYLSVLRETIPADRYDFIEYPTLYAERDETLAPFRKWIDIAVGKAAGVIQTEYIPGEDAVAVCYYELAPSPGEGFFQHLAVVSRPEERVIFRDTLSRRAQAPVSDTFFLIGSSLYYIREKSTLIALDLSRP